MPWLRSRTERSSGLTTWAIEWREGTKVRHRVLGPVTEQEAQYELAAMNAGKRTRQAKRTVDPARAVEDYLRHLKAAGRRQGTVDHDRDKLKPLVDEWGHRPLADWSRPHLEALLTERAWAPTRVRNALGVYRRFIAWCGQVGIVCGDFVAGFKPPRARPSEEREALSAEQCRKLLDAARGHHLEVPVALALLSGLSRADLRAITWKEVDLEAGLICRPRHKTGTRLRLPMSEPLREVLQRHRRRSGPVCPRLPTSDSSLSSPSTASATGPGSPGAAGTGSGTRRPPSSRPRGRTWPRSGGSWATGRGVGTLRYLHTDDDRLRQAAAAAARTAATQATPPPAAAGRRSRASVRCPYRRPDPPVRQTSPARWDHLVVTVKPVAPTKPHGSVRGAARHRHFPLSAHGPEGYHPPQLGERQ